MSTTSGLPNGCKGALLYGAPRMRVLRGKMLRTCECPGCFSPLRSGQGTASLAPLCGDPHSVKGVTFAVTPFIFYSLANIPQRGCFFHKNSSRCIKKAFAPPMRAPTATWAGVWPTNSLRTSREGSRDSRRSRLMAAAWRPVSSRTPMAS